MKKNKRFVKKFELVENPNYTFNLFLCGLVLISFLGLFSYTVLLFYHVPVYPWIVCLMFILFIVIYGFFNDDTHRKRFYWEEEK